MPKTIRQQFTEFTFLFTVEGYQFLRMRNFLEELEAKNRKTPKEIEFLEAFQKVSQLCEYFSKQR